MNQEYSNLTLPQLNGKLRYACRHRLLDEAKELIKQGADINGRDFHGQVPLHGAAQWGNVAIVEFLLEKGAKVNVQSNTGETPLDYAVKYNHSKVIEYLEAQLKKEEEAA